MKESISLIYSSAIGKVKSGVFCSVQKQYEEERLQRLVQEEAVKFLWKEVNN